MQTPPTKGHPAPDFTTTTSSGESVTLSALAGSFVVLFFYPRDSTPGCTREACGFRDQWEALNSLGAKVFGISTDSRPSHQKFIEKNLLPFSLLMDESRRITESYGAWGPKTFMGRRFMGTLRTTFLIDPQGRIAHVWEKVKPDQHAVEVVERIRQLMAS